MVPGTNSSATDASPGRTIWTDQRLRSIDDIPGIISVGAAAGKTGMGPVWVLRIVE